MAKRNSTKTATKEALSASEPRALLYNGWVGINIRDAALRWIPQDQDEHNQADLMDNFLMLQNNIDTSITKTLETRPDMIHLSEGYANATFSGVVHLDGDILIAAFMDGSIRWRYIGLPPETAWNTVNIVDPDGSTDTKGWSCIGRYQDTIICMSNEGEMFHGPRFDASQNYLPTISSAKFIPNPTTGPTITKKGSLNDGTVSRVSISFVYSNVYGTTLSSPWSTVNVDANPVEWSALKYLEVSGTIPSGLGITGVDMYCIMDENQDAIFIGHVTVPDTLAVAGGPWTYQWLGALTDTSVWTSVSLTVPTENTTKGVDATMFREHDGRLYFWGGVDKYRLWIGGNLGNELSVARGVGGGFVDIRPGSGLEIHGTHKFKTYNGASIVTIMSGNVNTNGCKRINLLETNTTITTEIATKGYMWEEVSNVVGCNSDYGSGVFADGLYSVTRYGLSLTTQAMESSNQLRTMYVSDNIGPVFEYQEGFNMNNCRIVCIRDVVYIAFSKESVKIPGAPEDPVDQDPYVYLDNVLLVYDIGAKAWWTYTIETNEKILHIFHVDHEANWEGVGIVTEDNIYMIPVRTKQQELVAPAFNSIIETGELSTRTPLQETTYLNQIEMKFDYFVGECTVFVDMVDYYGRHVTIEKHLNQPVGKYDWTEWIRIDKLVESYRIILKGPARFRLTHFIAKVYSQSRKINQVYGFDDRDSYINRNGGTNEHHHYIKDYNNLREAIVT